MSRSVNSVRNLLFGIGSQGIQTILPFISRTIFIHILGASFLGINSLFTSILSVLSLAELGIGNIVVYSLYKPLANKDYPRVATLVKFYKQVYELIAAAVFIIGIVLIPFLPALVNLPNNIENITLYYFLYVANSSLSYLFVYKTSIINADQKQYIVSLYNTGSIVVLTTLQIVGLLVFRSFLVYLIIQLLVTFGTNFLMSKKADKLFNLQNVKASKLTRSEKREIFSDTFSMLSYKLGGTFLNSTDSMYISALISTVTVGLYANYTMIQTVLNKFINIIYDSIYASVGNLNATADKNKRKLVFDALIIIFLWIGTVGFCGFYLCSGDVIRLWIGDKYELNSMAVISMSLQFYLPIILYPIWMYRNTTGLFSQTKSILIYAGLLNLGLSWLLGRAWGLPGILLATSISRVVTSFWYEPVVLYKNLFQESRVFEYFYNVAFSIATIVVVLLVNHFVFSSGSVIHSAVLHIFISVLLSIMLPSILFVIRFGGTNGFRYLTRLLKIHNYTHSR